MTGRTQLVMLCRNATRLIINAITKAKTVASVVSVFKAYDLHKSSPQKREHSRHPDNWAQLRSVEEHQ